MTTPRIYTRGLRQQLIPSGYVIGRTDRGRGASHLISIKELAGGLGSQAAGKARVEEILTVTLGGPFTANQQFVCPPAPRNANFPDTINQSTAFAVIPSTGNVNIMLCFNPALFLASGGTAGVFAKIAWTAGNTTGVVTYPNGGALTQGEVLTFVCPNDATLSGISLAFYGDLS